MRKKIGDHLSLFVIIAGAASFFLSNLLLKDVFDSDIYGHYSILISYFSLIYVVGIFGADQVFLRFSVSLEKDKIHTQKMQFVLVPIIVVMSSLIGTLVFKKNYPEVEINSVLLFFSSMGMIGILFLFSILRLNSDFVFAQITSNYWKLVMFVTAFLFYIQHNDLFRLFVNIILCNIILIFLVTLFYVYKKIQFQFNNDFTTWQIIQTSFHYFLSILSAALILFSDRFIIETKYDFKEFGNFFYLTNFFLAPYAILQNYISFKQLIAFKNNFNPEYYKKFNTRAIIFGLSMGFLLFFTALVLSYLKLIKFNFQNYSTIILILLATGTLRLFSSAINSAFEARTSLEMLRKSNLYIFLFTFFTLIFVVYYVNSIELILLNFILIWIFRCFIHNKLLFPKTK